MINLVSCFVFCLVCLFVFFSGKGGVEMADNPIATRYQYVLYVGQINSFARKVFC